MASDSYLKTWVSDKLMSLMGYSKSVVVQYVIRLAKESSSPGELVSKVVEFGISSSADTRSFAEEFYVKSPHKQSGLSLPESGKVEKETAQLAKKQRSYRLLDAGDNSGDDQVTTSATTSNQEKVKSHQKRFRRKSKIQDNEEDEEVATEESELHVQRHTLGMEDKEDDFESEEPRMKDQEESSQLERNIRERDAARTQKLMEPKLTDEEEEELIQRYVAFEKDDSSDLRKVSRQVYLQKRRDQKLLEIRDVIIDHEYIFEGVKLTEAEEQELSWIKKFASWRRTLCIEVSQLERNHRMPDDSTFSWHVVKCRCCIDLFTTHEEFSSFHFFLFLFVKFTCLIVKVSVVQQSNY